MIVIRMIKKVILDQLKQSFVEVKGFFLDNGKVILNVEVEEASCINEILDVIFNKTDSILQKTFFTTEMPVYGQDINVKMVG